MNKEELLKKIKHLARIDEKNRKDPRFTNTLGFLVAKGFLKTNLDVPLLPNKRLRIEDVIWAGVNVEPRILEVLPAAILRLGRHFDLAGERHPELARVVEQLKNGEDHGINFQGIPYAKLKVWVEFPLRDKRIKSQAQKKILKTFRLTPLVIMGLKKEAELRQCSETQLLEKIILNSLNLSKIEIL